jgi:heterodisulfide reductase subunit C
VSVLTPFSFARGLLVQRKLNADDYNLPIAKATQEVAGHFTELMNPDAAVPLNLQSSPEHRSALADNTFSQCFSCQTCTTVCPVVANYDTPEQVLGLLPHQIMCCLGLGLTEMAAGAKMIWDCLTCYQCQENCPQQVEVCDLLYDLKNMAVQERS